MSRRLFVTLPVVAALACSDPAPAPDLSVEAPGPYPVATARFTITRPDGGGDRVLPGQVWYPAEPGAAAAAAAGFPVEELEDEPNRTGYAGLLAQAPAGCPTRTVHAAAGAAVATGRFPLIGFSHCHQCTRFSAATVAERLASHGHVVVAVDHTGNTLWNQLGGDGLPLNTATSAVRADDLDFALDEVLAGRAVDPTVAAAVDATRVGVFGHSFGAVTAGLVAQRRADVGAAFALAAPMQNPLLPGVTVADLDRPLGFLVAVEDNSITELGNQLIRDNFAAAPGPAWKIEVGDAGHWSVSDLVGVVPGFAPGCGDGTRQTDGAPFTYLDPITGRAIAAAHVTAFFRATLSGDAGAAAYLVAQRPAGVVTAEAR